MAEQSPEKLAVMDLETIAHDLRTATRNGKKKDQPEGTRYIVVSDTLAKRWEEKMTSASKILEAKILTGVLTA